jgi:hypothetical protein
VISPLSFLFGFGGGKILEKVLFRKNGMDFRIGWDGGRPNFPPAEAGGKLGRLFVLWYSLRESLGIHIQIGKPAISAS